MQGNAHPNESARSSLSMPSTMAWRVVLRWRGSSASRSSTPFTPTAADERSQHAAPRGGGAGHGAERTWDPFRFRVNRGVRDRCAQTPARDEDEVSWRDPATDGAAASVLVQLRSPTRCSRGARWRMKARASGRVRAWCWRPSAARPDQKQCPQGHVADEDAPR